MSLGLRVLSLGRTVLSSGFRGKGSTPGEGHPGERAGGEAEAVVAPLPTLNPKPWGFLTGSGFCRFLLGASKGFIETRDPTVWFVV